MVVALCDDNRECFDEIKHAFEKVWDGEARYYEYDSVTELEENINGMGIELIFPDIDFEDRSSGYIKNMCTKVSGRKNFTAKSIAIYTLGFFAIVVYPGIGGLAETL